MISCIYSNHTNYNMVIDADNCMYCESCFYSKAQALVDNGQHPKYVLFKNILGIDN